MSGWGLDSEYQYEEYWLDSLNNSGSQGAAPATDWPVFEFGNVSLNDVVGIKVLEAQIPFSYYVFTTINGSFNMVENGFASTVVTIPPGNYSTVDFEAIMVTALNTASTISGSGNTWTVTYSTSTGKITYKSSTTPFSFNFGSPGNTYSSDGKPIQMNTGNRNPRLWIGFPAGTTYSNGTTLEAPNASLLSGPNYLLLNSTQLGSGIHGYLPKGAIALGGGPSGPQMSMIPVNVNENGIIQWQDPSPLMWFIRDTKTALTSLDFYFTLGNLGSTFTQYPLAFNGLSFSLKLGLLLRNKETASSQTSTFQGGRVTERLGLKRARF